MRVTITGVGAVVASAGALFFALGYVVVNARLASYGVNEVAPPSARFVAVGMLASLFFGAAYLVRFIPALRPETLFATRPASTRTRRTRRQRLSLVVRTTVLLGAVLLLLGTVEATLIELIAQATDDRAFGYLLAFLLAWNLLPIVAFALIPLDGPWYSPHVDLRPARPWLVVLRIVAALPLLQLTLALYAQSAFKYVPQWAGGGRLVSVQLVLAEPDRELCPECDQEGATYVLLEDGDRMVLFLNLEGHRRVIELPRSIIRAVVHPPR